MREDVSDSFYPMQVVPRDFPVNSEAVPHDNFRMEGFKGSDLVVEHGIFIFVGQFALV
jgi:hypothetical protein